MVIKALFNIWITYTYLAEKASVVSKKATEKVAHTRDVVEIIRSGGLPNDWVDIL